MNRPGKKLGIMIAAPPDSANFTKALELAENALRREVLVYLYCIDRGVEGLLNSRLQSSSAGGAKLFACAFSVQERGLEEHGGATLSGLTILSDIISAADQFASFT